MMYINIDYAYIWSLNNLKLSIRPTEWYVIEKLNKTAVT